MGAANIGRPDDFPRLVQLIASFDPLQSASAAVRRPFAIGWKVGGLLGLGDPEVGLSSGVPTLLDGVPADLRETPSVPNFPPGPYSDKLDVTQLYLTNDEWAVEIASRTVDAVLHFGWVPDGTGGYRGPMLVKRHGLLGAANVGAIAPFRHLIVCPPISRDIERTWRGLLDDATPAHAYSLLGPAMKRDTALDLSTGCNRRSTRSTRDASTQPGTAPRRLSRRPS